MTKKAKARWMKVVVWGMSSISNDYEERNSIDFEDVIHAVAFSPLGNMLAAGGETCAIAILNSSSNLEKISDMRCSAGVRCLAWSPDSHFLACGGEDMQMSVWDVFQEQLVFRSHKARDWLTCVAFSADSLWLAYCANSTCTVSLQPVELCETD